MRTTKFTLVLLLIIASFSGCKLDTVDYTKTTPGSGGSTTGGSTTGGATTGGGTSTNTGEYYFKGKLNAQTINWQGTDDFSGWVTGSSSRVSNDKGVISGEIGALFSASDGFKPQLGVGFRTFKINFDEDKVPYFRSFFSTGAWDYATNDDFTFGKKVIVIYYTDKTGKQYISAGVQTGSAANIVTITPLEPELGRNDGVKIKLTFNCTLYPTDGNGSPLVLTGAEATVRVDDAL